MEPANPYESEILEDLIGRSQDIEGEKVGEIIGSIYYDGVRRPYPRERVNAPWTKRYRQHYHLCVRHVLAMPWAVEDPPITERLSGPVAIAMRMSKRERSSALPLRRLQRHSEHRIL